jgi:4-amino-4-deoxy-L-arabinose transferase-like glycosyltransferase
MNFPSALARLVSAFQRPLLFVPVAGLLFLATSLHAVLENAQTPRGRKDFLEGDTGHYLDIAHDFSRGDFSMSYVRNRPHRQPLYPLLLAPVMLASGENLAALAMVNVVLTVLTFLLVYFGLLHRLGSRVVAAAAGALFLLNPFVRAQCTQHLLTEPLHLFLMVGILFAFWDYLETRRSWSLIAAAALGGLDYLARPNGLFVTLALVAVVVLVEGRRLLTRRGMIALGLAALAFVTISAPSWVPRYRDFGNPIHHGYLSNYLWVDTYAEGHVGQRFATRTARDYFAHHGVLDVAKRWLQGAWECGMAIPVRVEGRFPLLFFLALGGAGIVLCGGPRSLRALLLFGIVQALPLVWTNLSNPTVRVPYAAAVPFELVFAAVALHFAIEAVRSRSAAAIGSPGGRVVTAAFRPGNSPRPARCG